MPSFRKEDTIDLGRLWIEKYRDNSYDEVESKSKEFLSWYSRITRWIRKSYQRDGYGDYVSPRVQTLVNNGISLIK